MTEHPWYQTSPDGYTALLLARVRTDGRPDYVIPHFGQDAYENYAASLYFRELYRALDGDAICWSPGFPYIYAGIKVLMERHPHVRVVEVGSTLFAAIDKIRKCERRFGPLPSEARLSFRGIEISDFFNRIARSIHPGESITFGKHYTEPTTEHAVDVGRCYQASSYAFATTDQFVDWVARTRFSVQGAWFNPDGADHTTCAMGKRLTLFHYDRFVEGLAARGIRVHHVHSDRYTLHGGAFIASWLVTEQFDDDERDAFARLCVATAGLNTEGVVHADRSWSSEAVRAITDAGPHSGGIDPDDPPQSLRFPLTFDFGSRGLEAKFGEHLVRVHGDGAGAA